MDEVQAQQEVLRAIAKRLELKIDIQELNGIAGHVSDLWTMAEDLLEVTTPKADAPSEKAGASFPKVANPSSTTLLGSAASMRANDAFCELTIRELKGAYRDGSTTPVEVVASLLARIELKDPLVRSYITVAAEQALDEAERLTKELGEGRTRGPLHGVPIAVKDSIPVAGMPFTRNTAGMRNVVPSADPEVIGRLKESGAIIIGKTNMNPAGWSLPSESDFTPPPRNPWIPEEYSMGSSSGSAAAVSARLCFGALGTDGGGSVRLPAAQHMLFGLKPGHDVIPRGGVNDNLNSDIGVLTRDWVDAVFMFQALSGTTSQQLEGEYNESAGGHSMKGVRFAVPYEYIANGNLEPDVGDNFDRLLAAMASMGAGIESPSRESQSIIAAAHKATFVVIAANHFSRNEHVINERDRFGDNAWLYNLPGGFLSAADYMRAEKVRALVRRELDEVLTQYDYLLLPTTPITRTSTAREPVGHRRGYNSVFTSPFNLSGHPAISFPIGISSEGIPIGGQLIGRHGSEMEMIRAAGMLSALQSLPPFPML